MKIKMLIYKKYIFSFAILIAFCFFNGFSSSLLAQEASGDDEKVHVCFFELSNTTASKNFINKTKGVKVHPYKIEKQDRLKGMSEREAGKRAFERMIKAGHKCDSLVISGHHTGDWFGDLGNLWLEDMEELSCKNKNWFKKIKALWLDGCNTVTDKFIESGSALKTVDSESVRVFEQRPLTDEIVLEDAMKTYQQSYTATLDENTPLSSRYLRMFPDTQVYGFSGAAPDGTPKEGRSGGQMGDRSFIYEHIAKLGRAIKAEEKQNQTMSHFKRGLKTLLLNDEYCDPEKLSSWEDVHPSFTAAVDYQDYTKETQLGCNLILAKQVLDNPDSSSAQKSLAQYIQQQIKDGVKYGDQQKKILKLANQILKNPNSKSAIKLAKLSVVHTLDFINREDENIKEGDKTYSHLLFNNLYDTWNVAKKYKIKDSGFLKKFNQDLKKIVFLTPLKKGLNLPYTASLKKGDYIKFYTEIFNIDTTEIHNANSECSDGDQECKKTQFLKDEIQKLLNKVKDNFSELRSSRKWNLNPEIKRVLSVSVLDQLVQYDFLSKAQADEFSKNKELFPLEDKEKNSFFFDNWIKLKFTSKPEQIISDIEKEKNPAIKKSIVRVGANVYLKQNNKEQLVNFSNQIDVSNFDLKHSFHKSLHDHLSNKTDEEKVDLIYDLSLNTGDNLEELVLLYMRYNFVGADSKLKNQLYDKIVDEGTHSKYRTGKYKKFLFE